MKINCLLFSLLMLTALGAAAQTGGGTITFANDHSSLVLNGRTGGAVTAADGIRAALYWSPLSITNFVALGPTVQVGVPLPGLFADGTRTTGVETPGGSLAQFQVRAWSGGYPSYEEASTHPETLLGRSPVLVALTGGPGGEPPTPPGALQGLQSFTLVLTNVPPVPGDLNGDGIVDQYEINAALTIYWAQQQPVSMTNPVKQSDGFFQFALTNLTGWNYSVLVSSNQVDWTELGPARPVFQFVDPAAGTGATARFYRLRYP